MKRWRIGLLGAVVSILAIYFIVSQIDLAALGRALAEARYIYVLPTVALLLAGLVTRALRWRVLLSGGLPLTRAFHIMNVAYLVNGVLPLRLGEVARIYLSARAEPPVPPPQTLSTIVVERLLDLFAVVILLGLALVAGPVPEELRLAASLVVPAMLIGFLALVLLSAQRNQVLRLLAGLVGRLDRGTGQGQIPFFQKMSLWLVQFLDGLTPLTQPRALAQALLWTVVSWGFSTVAGYILMLAFFPQASWAVTYLYIAATALAVAVPAVPGNLGPYELSVLLALGAAGYGEPPDVAAAFALVVHGVNLGLNAVTGIIGLLYEGISLGQLSRGVRDMRQNNRMVIQDVASPE